MNWAWGLRLKPNVKFVFMALADACDDEGYCWPSVPALARKTSLDDRSVQRILNQLKAGGLIRVAPRFRQDRSPNSNRYRLALNPPAGEGIGWARIGGCLDTGVVGSSQPPPLVTKGGCRRHDAQDAGATDVLQREINPMCHRIDRDGMGLERKIGAPHQP